MEFQNVKRLSEINQLLTIQPKRLDCGATGRSQTNHQSRISAPGKVIRPSLAPGIEQSRSPARQRINSHDLIVFV